MHEPYLFYKTVAFSFNLGSRWVVVCGEMEEAVTKPLPVFKIKLSAVVDILGEYKKSNLWFKNILMSL